MSSTNDAGRSTPGAPISSGRAARRNSQASATESASSKARRTPGCSSPARAASRCSPASASPRVPLILHEQHGAVVAFEHRRQAPEAAQVGRAAQRHQVEQLDRRRARGSRIARRWLRAPGAGSGTSALRRDASRDAASSSISISVKSASVPSEPPGGGRGSAAPRRARAGRSPRRGAGSWGTRAGCTPSRARASRRVRRRSGRAPAPRCRRSRGALADSPTGPKADRLAAGEHAAHAQRLVDGLAVDDRARARRVVADHAADRRLLDGRGVGPELETVRGGGTVERPLDDAGLDPRDAAIGVDREDAVEVEAVDRDAVAESLAGEARGGAAHAERHLELGRHRRGGGEVVDRAGDEHGVGHDAVDRGVGRVEPARQAAGLDRAGDLTRRAPGRRPARARRAHGDVARRSIAGSIPNRRSRHAATAGRRRAGRRRRRRPREGRIAPTTA